MRTTTQQQFQKHLDEWVSGSGVSEAIARLNFESLDDPKEIARRLGWEKYMGPPGWWGGTENFGQWKPDEPILFPDSDKPKKYLTPKGKPVDGIKPLVDDKTWERIAQRYGKTITQEEHQRGFWAWVNEHPDIPVFITEGLKKACALLTSGYVASAIVGVDCGQRQGQLLPELAEFAVQGRPVNLVFDADIVIKPEVQQALKRLGYLIKKQGCLVFVCEWDLQLGKGCDDFIVLNGSDDWEKVAENPTPYGEWLKKLEGQFQGNQKQKAKGNGKQESKPPEALVIAVELVEKYRSRLAWNDEFKSWFRYEAEVSGVWSIESDIAVEGVVGAELDSDPRTALQYKYSYLTDVIKLMRSRLLVRHWDTSYGLGFVPLTDGVLHLATMELRPHAPGYRLLWCLPYPWGDRGIGSQPVQDWMLSAMKGDRTQVEVLRAYLNAVVTGRFDLQRYLECIGPGGTGKGTYTRLAMALVGAENTTVTTLEQLEKNRFETAGIYGKRLLMITDSERYGGEVSVLKAITGGDAVRYERKNVQQTKPFTPTCMVILASNEPVQSSDYTSGLERRRLTIPFIHQVKADERRDLDAEFKPYLPGLLEWVLAMPDDQVTALVRNTSSTVPSLVKWKAETLIDTNPMAEWLDLCVIHDCAAKTYIGTAKRDKSSDSPNLFQFPGVWLYANYSEHTTATGSKPVSGRRFSTLLHDLCVNQLKLEDVGKGRDNRGAYFQGLAIRNHELHDGWPRPITGDDTPPDEPPNGGGGSSPPHQPNPSDGNVMASDGKVTPETRTSDGSDGSDGNFQSVARSEIQIELQFEKVDSKEPECENLPSLPSPIPEASSRQGFQPSPDPSRPITIHHHPSPSAQHACAPKIGERVRLPDGQLGIVEKVYPEGELGVSYDGGLKFGMWKPSELTIVAPSDDDGDDDPDGGGSGNPSIDPAPNPGDDGGCAVIQTQSEEPAPHKSTEATTQLPLDSQQMHLVLPLAESPTLAIRPHSRVEWLDPESTNYQEQLRAITDAQVVSLDIETYQVDQPKKNVTPKALHPWQSQIRLIQMCIGEQTFLVDFGDRDSDFALSLNRHQPTIELLRQVLQNPDQRIVGHNIHFDLRFLATKLGIRNAKNIVCTMTGAQVYYGDYGAPEGDTKGKHEPILTGGYSLANLAHRLLGVSLDKREQKSDWGAVLTSEQIKYAAQDPQTTLRVYEAMEALYIDEKEPLYSKSLRESWKLECDVIPCAVEIELAGMPLDAHAAKQQLDTIEAHRMSLLKDWAKLCPDIKYTQVDKLRTHLNQKYQLGLSSLDKGSLDTKSRENPLIQIRLKLQGLDALANNLKGFLTSATRDGRVHTTYKTLTGFGRFSSGGGTPDLPNLQSIKAKSIPILDEFKLPHVRAVIKPQHGRTMAVIDLAGAHGRIAADQTEDETAIAGNNDPSIDNHSKVAVFIAKAQGLDWTWEDIAKVRKDKANPDSVRAGLFRDTAKNTYYGWLNGAGAKRIQEQITANTGMKPALSECEAAIEGCKVLYPGVLKHRKQLMKRLRTDAINIDGRLCAVNTTSDGFRICLPLEPGRFNEGRLEPPYTQSLASIWSRIEATAIKRALIQIMDAREQHPEWCLEVINYVHDEIDIEVNSEFARVAAPLVNDNIGDCFAAQLKRVSDGRETQWEKLIVESWADK